MEINGTVTIPLQEYKDMENELSKLRKQVQEKTIYKYYMHPIYGNILLIMVGVGLMLLAKYG